MTNRFLCNGIAALLTLLLILSVSACGKKTADLSDSQSPKEIQESAQGNNTKDNQETQQITLYFSDDQAMNLVPEVREIAKNKDETMESIVIHELIKGPANKQLGQVIPDGTKLLSTEVADGVAYIDFSKEFRENHWGGSAGETMTVYAVVNSLCKLPDVNKVQFLLEGVKQDNILNGNMDTSLPIEPDFSLVTQ